MPNLHGSVDHIGIRDGHPFGVQGLASGSDADNLVAIRRAERAFAGYALPLLSRLVLSPQSHGSHDGSMPRSSLPAPSVGDVIAGCTYLSSFKGGASGGTTFWKLKCICGFEFDRRASEHWYYAKKGVRKLCKNKHLHTDLEVGSRFGRLIITSFEKREVKTTKGVENRGYAICDCACGTVGFAALPERLRDGSTQSCGCYLKESVGDRFRTHGKTDTREFDLWAAAKERADKTGIPFDIELDDIQIPEVCPVLGIPIDMRLGRGRRQPDSPSLDKFVPDKGYTKGNIQVISWRANWLKNNGTVEEWVRIAQWCEREDVRRRLKGDA